MLKIILYLLGLALSYPAGLFLYKLCNDEITKWRFRLNLLSLFSIILAILLYFSNFNYKIPVILGLFFIILTNITIIIKSYEKLMKKIK
ncbi:MAG: hypothetical protein WC867_01550 [Candidatus Pacearchaeota archaeon]|jgi:hypothetical protein